jgi:hypothetical protein
MKMNHKQRELLEDGGYFDWWDYWDYENEDDFNYYYDDYIDYERLENGLVDWSEEVPQSVKRQHKIDQILNENLEDNSYNLGKFWPK